MRDIGQLQPIVVTPDLHLVAGERRLVAARSLGWNEIDAKIATDLTDAALVLRAERDENTCRKAFTPTEEHSLYEALLALERPLAAERQQLSRFGADDPDELGAGNFPAPSGKAKESVAEIISGFPGRYKTLDKVGELKEIVGDPTRPDTLREKAHDALREIDRFGNVDGPYRRVKLAEKATRPVADISLWSADEQARFKSLHEGDTVVVNQHGDHANLIRWAEAEGLFLPIDRRTEWGNPFLVPYDGDRKAVIRSYAQHYLPYKPSLLERVGELRGKALGCWCAPEPCDGDVLVDVTHAGGDGWHEVVRWALVAKATQEPLEVEDT